jgi:hypothetical protein
MDALLLHRHDSAGESPSIRPTYSIGGVAALHRNVGLKVDWVGTHPRPLLEVQCRILQTKLG